MSFLRVSRRLPRIFVSGTAGALHPKGRQSIFDGVFKCQARNKYTSSNASHRQRRGSTSQETLKSPPAQSSEHNNARPNQKHQEAFPPLGPSQGQGQVNHVAQELPNEHQLRDYLRQVRNHIPLLRPAVWAIAFSAGTYAFLAYLEAREETKPKPTPSYQWGSLIPGPRHQSSNPTEVASVWWNGLDPMSKLGWGIVGTCGAIQLSSIVVPSYWNALWHIPVVPRSWTLFSSTFVHGGAMHLFFNMWACSNFLPPTGRSPLFDGSANHMLAFFISTGVLSGYAQHVAAWVKPSQIAKSGGASGALLAVLGAFCMQYPNAQLGIMFLPFSIDASTFLPLMMAFDAYGMVRGFSAFKFGHAAHLSGTLIGISYSYFDGKNKIWKPLVRFFKRRMDKGRA